MLIYILNSLFISLPLSLSLTHTHTQSNEILILGRKISALEAYERNLVTRIFPKNDLQNQVKEIVSEIAQLPPQSVLKSKSLIRSTFGHMLEEANAKECELLRERWLSEECMQAIIKFMERKNKSLK